MSRSQPAVRDANRRLSRDRFQRGCRHAELWSPATRERAQSGARKPKNGCNSFQIDTAAVTLIGISTVGTDHAIDRRGPYR